MKKVARIALGAIGPMLLALLFLVFSVSPARAPQGGKQSLGGRTIASIQEEEFDKKILTYQMCYGLKFNAESSTQERRRVCKAILVHMLESVLATPGAHFRGALEVKCENTVFAGRNLANAEVVLLKPNQEFQALEQLLVENLVRAEVSEREDFAAREACHYLIDCKLAMQPNRVSLRKIAYCLQTPNATHRNILLDEVSGLIFHQKTGRAKPIYEEMLEEARK